MKSKGRGFLQLLLIIAAMAGLLAIVIFGFGSTKKGSLEDVKLGLDLAGGVSITYESVKENPTAEEMEDTVYKLKKRVDNYSTEADVYQEGDDRINVDIPGVTDANQILKELGKAGALQFIDESGKVVLDGSDIQSADAAIYNSGTRNEYIVELTLTPAGSEKFAKVTKANVGKTISIYYDNVEVSAPRVKSEITGGKASIDGQETFEEAKELASVIRIGALPLELKEIRSNIVGAKLGAEAINTSLLAGIIGFILVILFMIIVYRVPGLAAGIALILYISIVLIALNIFNVTLTLPGVAGIILSIGMAVDANVIIFTRMREELGTGKTVRSAIKIGFNKALSAIVDGNVTTLIAAAVLWLRGSGTIKGFAQTLAIGILVSMFTALIITKFVMTALYNLGLDKESMYGREKEIKVFPFVKHKNKFFIASLIVIGIGIAALFVNKATIGSVLEYGLDFSGGTSTEVTFNEELPEDINPEIRALVSDIIGDPNVELSKIRDANAVIIKTKELTLDQRTAIAEKLESDYGVDPGLITTESISATVSNDMKQDAIVAVIIATVCMLIYIWIRFKDVNFASSAVLALVHDVLIVLMVYAVARISVSSTFIACMLTIVGYSINATIIIFDRIRENLSVKLNKESIEEVVNNSISQTVTRCINTSLTTFIMVFVLFLLGVDSIKIFAAPLMVGIICGAYSSICITGTMWFALKSKFMKVTE
jgi:SecD/SecF fusion protein